MQIMEERVLVHLMKNAWHSLEQKDPHTQTMERMGFCLAHC